MKLFLNKKISGMKKRGALGFSINVLITIIVGIIILSLAIPLGFKLFSKAVDYNENLDARTESRIKSLLSEGLPVEVLDTVKTAEKRQATFAVGIKNIEEEGTFTIEITGPKFLGDKTVDLSDMVSGQGNIQTPSPITLQRNEQAYKLVLINFPSNKPPGKYSFVLKVKKDGNDYQNAKKIFVILE